MFKFVIFVLYIQYVFLYNALWLAFFKSYVSSTSTNLIFLCLLLAFFFFFFTRQLLPAAPKGLGFPGPLFMLVCFGPNVRRHLWEVLWSDAGLKCSSLLWVACFEMTKKRLLQWHFKQILVWNDIPPSLSSILSSGWLWLNCNNLLQFSYIYIYWFEFEILADPTFGPIDCRHQWLSESPDWRLKTNGRPSESSARSSCCKCTALLGDHITSPLIHVFARWCSVAVNEWRLLLMPQKATVPFAGKRGRGRPDAAGS